VAGYQPIQWSLHSNPQLNHRLCTLQDNKPQVDEVPATDENVETRSTYYDDEKLKLKEKIQYKDGLPHGKAFCYFENGQIGAEENFIEGVAHGKEIYYHENGQIASDKDMKDGKQHGKELVYDESGNVVNDTDYEEG